MNHEETYVQAFLNRNCYKSAFELKILQLLGFSCLQLVHSLMTEFTLKSCERRKPQVAWRFIDFIYSVDLNAFVIIEVGLGDPNNCFTAARADELPSLTQFQVSVCERRLGSLVSTSIKPKTSGLSAVSIRQNEGGSICGTGRGS